MIIGEEASQKVCLTFTLIAATLNDVWLEAENCRTQNETHLTFAASSSYGVNLIIIV
jgi:hypothetical protein